MAVLNLIDSGRFLRSSWGHWGGCREDMRVVGEVAVGREVFVFSGTVPKSPFKIDCRGEIFEDFWTLFRRHENMNTIGDPVKDFKNYT